MRIIAVDPGLRTGLALAGFPGPAFRSWEADASAMDDVEGRLPATSLVVCESFIPRPGVRTWQPDALEMIGALRYICRRDGVPFELQSPAEAKRFSTNARLKIMGWRNITPGGHADDAARHLLLAAVKRGLIDVNSL